MDATARPSNPGSWKALTKNGFGPAVDNLSNEEPIDFDCKGIDSFDALEASLVKLYDPSVTPTPLTVGTRYRLHNQEGKLWTVSRKPEGYFSTHWECTVPD